MGFHYPNHTLHLPGFSSSHRPARTCNNILEPSKLEFQHIYCTINIYITWQILGKLVHWCSHRQRSDRVNPTPGRSPYSDTLQYVRNQRSHPDAPPEHHEETSDKEENTAEETDPTIPQTEAEVGIPIPGPPNYRTSETFHHERNLRVPPMPDTLAALFNNPPRREVVEAPVQRAPVQVPAYDSWAHYFQQHPEMHTNWQSHPSVESELRDPIT